MTFRLSWARAAALTLVSAVHAQTAAGGSPYTGPGMVAAVRRAADLSVAEGETFGSISGPRAHAAA